MKNKLIIFNIIVLTLALAVVLATGISVNSASHYDEAAEQIVELTKVYVANYNDHIADNVPQGIRVTVIASDGTVVADSSAEDVADNHLARPEVSAAFAGNPTIAERYSETIGADMMYYAETVTYNEQLLCVRVAIPVQTVNGYVAKTVPTLVWVLLAALLVSVGASVMFGNNLVKPMRNVRDMLVSVNNGTYTEMPVDGNDADVNALVKEINAVSATLEARMRMADEYGKRLDYIVDNIADGIVVLDVSGVVTVQNKVAEGVFGVSRAVGKSYNVLTSDKTFTSAVKQCMEQRTDVKFELTVGAATYYVSVCARDDITVVVLTDITAVKNNEQMRSEFFANASHELKTPLTAIKGFNDMVGLTCGNEKICELSSKIDREVGRMVNLINDMLALAKLEGEKPAENVQSVDLVAVADDVADTLSTLAAERNVTVDVTGRGSAHIDAEHARTLVKNLVENAIRYNDDGGYVHVTVSHDQTNGETTLTVADNGIGIEEEHQQRVFERFYRVSKSRSRESGGTGLGLAIVKHIATLYNAKLSLQSKYGVGTTVTVTFLR